MTHPIKIAVSKITHFSQLKSLRTSTALILATLMLVAVAATSAASAQTYTDLCNFNGARGEDPEGGSLAQGRDGNLYGTTVYGGTNNEGVVFEITPGGKLKVLYSFDTVHGFYPSGQLTLGTDGNYYGTASGGGTAYGTVFKITPSGNLTTLYSFTGGSDGGTPWAPPIQATDGSLYGTTWTAVYKVTPSGAFTSLGSIPGQSYAPLLQGTDGNFYGTTYNGGTYGYGTVFRITSAGIVTTVYNFDGTHGENPYAAVIQSSDGYFYGTTRNGGSNGEGVAFKLTPEGAIAILHNFPDPSYPNDGYYLNAGFVQATDGNFYSATSYGGTGVCDCGVIFQITQAGAYSILYSFDGGQGERPLSPMQHTDGKIYGLTSWGGGRGDGVVYSFDVGLVPFVSLVSTSGKAGKNVEVLGQGFTGTTAVSFNGTPATFTVVADTFLKATVPVGATTGFVTVTTPSGTLTSNQKFRVRP